jgi:hypothetical protein
MISQRSPAGLGRLLLAALLTAAIVVVARWAFQDPPDVERTDPITAPHTSRSPGSRSTLRAAPAPAPRTPGPGDEEGVPPSTPPDASDSDSRIVYSSSLQYLEQFWGPRWPELRASLELHAPHKLARYESLALTADLVPPPLPEIADDLLRQLLEAIAREDWTEGKARMANAEPWPDQLSPDFVTELLQLLPGEVTDDLVGRVESIGDRYRSELAALRLSYFEAVRRAAESEARARAYVAWPLVQVGPGIDARSGEVSDRQAAQGDLARFFVTYEGLWAVWLSVRGDDYPDARELGARMREAGRRRLKEAQRLLRDE